MDLPLQAAPGRVATEVIDCDVHPLVPNALETLAPYIPRAWNERFRRKGTQFQGTSGVPLRFQHPNGSVPRNDARGPKGGNGGIGSALPDRRFARRKRRGHRAARTASRPGRSAAALSGAEEMRRAGARLQRTFPAGVAAARPRGCASLRPCPCRIPRLPPRRSAASARIRQVAAISLPLLNIQMGNRWYWPIYEAAAEQCGLPVFLHVTGIESLIAGTPQITAGSFDHYIDRYLAMPQLAESSVRNLVFSGTMERFPKLNFVFAEFGFLWLLPLLWRMDRVWRGLRHDVPWVRKPAERDGARALLLHHAAGGRTRRSARPRAHDDADRRGGALLQLRLSALGQRHAWRRAALPAAGTCAGASSPTIRAERCA